MIYQIYRTYHNDKYTPTVCFDEQRKSKHLVKKCKIKQATSYLLPYRIPEAHFDSSKINQQMDFLNKSLESVKQLNYKLARKILFTNSKSEARRFLHKTRQILGTKNITFSKASVTKTKIVTSNINRQQQDKSIKQTVPKQADSSQLYDIENISPNFSVTFRNQTIESREDRRKNLGITDAELFNYQKSRRGLPSSAKRKLQSTHKPKDFKKMNMKGFTAKISASLGSKQNVNISTLTRMMNVDMTRGVRLSFEYKKAALNHFQQFSKRSVN